MNSFASFLSPQEQESFEAMIKHWFRRKDDTQECTNVK